MPWRGVHLAPLLSRCRLCACLCSRNRSAAAGTSGTTRIEVSDLGFSSKSPERARFSWCVILISECSKSMSDHESPNTSPTRKPVHSASLYSAQNLEAAARYRNSSFCLSDSATLCRWRFPFGLISAAAGFLSVSPFNAARLYIPVITLYARLSTAPELPAAISFSSSYSWSALSASSLH